MERILQSKEDSRGHCLQCHAWFLVELPKVKKKLIYIDQSLMSDLFRVNDGTPQWELVQRILRKLQRLKELQKVFLVVSDIHSAETSAIPEEYAGQRDSLWRFQNSLADGKISGNWHDVFVAQQRRALATPGMHECFPGVDIGLDDPHRWQVGIKVVLTNAWRGRLLRTSSPAPNLNDRYRQIITSQVDALGSSVEMRDTLGHVLSLWRKDLEEGIDAVRRLNRLRQSRDGIELLTPADLTVLSQSLASHFKGVVTEVIKGMDADAALDHWLAQLESGKNCAALRVRIAFEAELLWSVVQGKRLSLGSKFSGDFGVSRQNDIDHVSAFFPYVDALTTDKDMHNLCGRTMVKEELDTFPCLLFSSKNYNELDSWLDTLLI